MTSQAYNDNLQLSLTQKEVDGVGHVGIGLKVKSYASDNSERIAVGDFREFSLYNLLGGQIFDPMSGEYRERKDSEFISLISLTADQIAGFKKLLSDGCHISTRNAVSRILIAPTRFSHLSDWWTKRIKFQGALVTYIPDQSYLTEIRKIRKEIRDKCTSLG